MGWRNRYDGLNSYAVDKVRATAWGMVGLRGLTISDVPDLEQELIIDLHKRLPKFDPEKSSMRTFITTVVENRAATILEKLRTKRRKDLRAALSLDKPYEMADGSIFNFLDELDPRKCLTGTARWSRTKAEKEALSMDMEAFLETLPHKLHVLCLMLRHQTVTEVSESLGVARSTIYTRLAKIRKLLKEAGLDEYL